MPDPIYDEAATAQGHLVALFFAHARAIRRNARQRVACLPLDDPRRRVDVVRYVVTDA